MKKHSLVKALLTTLLIVVLASWTLQITKVSGKEFVTEESIKIGLFTVLSYLRIVFQYFLPIFLYVLAIGGLYGVLHKIPQYRLLLDKIANGFKDKEWIFFVIVGIVLALLSSMAGLSLALLFIFPFVISVVLLMGYDKITAAMLTVGSTIAGLIGSVFSTYDVSGISAVLEEYGGYAANGNVLIKIVLLVVALAIVLVNTILYAKKHQDRKHLVKGYYIPEKVQTENKKTYPIVVVLDLVLVILALAFISWDLLNVKLFNDMTTNFVTPTGSAFTKGLYGAFNTVLGVTTSNAFGNWTIFEGILVILFASWLLSFIYKNSFSKYLTNFGEGAKKALLPAMLSVLAYLILVCAVNVPFEMTLLKNIVSLDGGVQIITMCIIAIVYCFFTVEAYYGVTTASTYILAVVTSEKAGLVGLIWQTMYGLTMLIAPTSIILLSTLSYLDISYTKWLKSIWLLLLELFAAIFIILLFV